MVPERDRRRPPVPTADDLECVCAGMAQIDVTEIAWIISHLNLSEPVALGDENAEPWRIIVDRVDAHPLWRQAAFSSGQEGDQDLQGIVVVPRQFRCMSAPCRDWRIERLAVLALIHDLGRRGRRSARDPRRSALPSLSTDSLAIGDR